jgi:hypothetical protein
LFSWQYCFNHAAKIQKKIRIRQSQAHSLAVMLFLTRQTSHLGMFWGRQFPQQGKAIPTARKSNSHSKEKRFPRVGYFDIMWCDATQAALGKQPESVSLPFSW